MTGYRRYPPGPSPEPRYRLLQDGAERTRGPWESNLEARAVGYAGCAYIKFCRTPDGALEAVYKDKHFRIEPIPADT